MKTFRNLVFKKKFSKKELKFIPYGYNAVQAKLMFRNGYGVSVISGFGSYSDADNPYEIAITTKSGLCYTSGITDDVIGYCNVRQVTAIMKRVQRLPK